MASSADRPPQNRYRFTDVNKEPNKPLQPLPKHPNKPLPSLQDAVKPIEKLIDDLTAQVTRSLDKCQHPKDGLTQDQSAALYLYSLQWPKGKHSFYELFNRALRDENRIRVAPYFDYLHLFMSALEKLPSVQDRVWRGVNADSSGQYQPESVHVWSGVSSCSDMVHVTDAFLNQATQRTLFNIKCFGGKMIKNHSDFPTESETILPPEFCFRVKSVSNPAPNFHIIDVEQIPFEQPTEEATSSINESVSAYSVCLIWLDASVNTSKDNVDIQKQLRKIHTLFNTFQDAGACEKFIQLGNKNSRVVLIVGGQMGRQFLPRIQDLAHVVAVFVYCMNKEANEEWARNYAKIRVVTTRAKELVKQVEQEISAQLEEAEKAKNNAQDTFTDLTDAEHVFEARSDLEAWVLKMPLVSIEEAVEPLVDLVPDVQRNVYMAKLNCEHPADGLTVDQSAAIMLLTMEAAHSTDSLYYILNHTLRSQEDRRLENSWILYLRLIFSGLRKLPPFRGMVYRGVRTDLRIQYRTGSTCVWFAFSPATTSPEILENEQILGQQGPRSLFQIECTSGRNIREHSFFQYEDEVLLLPGFRFVVKSVLNAGNGLDIITVKEIEKF